MIVIGGLTRATIQNLQVVERDDVVSRVDSAWMNSDSTVICLRGARIDTEKKTEYGIRLPVVNLTAIEPGTGIRISVLRDFMVVGREHLLESCEEAGSRLTIQRVISDSDYVISVDDFLHANPEIRPVLSVIEFGPASGPKGFIVLFPDGTKIRPVRIDVKGIERPGPKWWFAVLPFAIVADVLTYPVQILMWANYAGSH